jgi:hypothetical protein
MVLRTVTQLNRLGPPMNRGGPLPRVTEARLSRLATGRDA